MPISIKRSKMFCVAFATACILGASGLAAADVGNVQAGERFARETCASCHAVEKGAKASPVAEAPTFEAVANSPGMNRLALIVFFRTPHKEMPNLIIQGDESDDIIAYILSLKAK